MSFKNKNLFLERPFFTHFASIPLIQPKYRNRLKQIQQQIRFHIHKHPKNSSPQVLKQHHHELGHITLFKLTLRHSQTRNKMIQFMKEHEELIRQTLYQIVILITNLNYFTRFNKNEKCKQIIVIYAEIQKNTVKKINKLVDRLMRVMLKEQIVSASQFKEMNVYYDHNENLYKPQTLHVSLFRARNLLEDDKFIEIFKELQQKFKPFQAQCRFLDISTMGGELDETNFYLPLYRTIIKQNKSQQESELQKEGPEINRIQ